MKRLRISDTLLENIIKILSEEETGGFTIDAMMKTSSELNKRLTSDFFHPIIKHASRLIKAHTYSIRSLEWSPDGQKIMSGSLDEIEIWDALTGKPIKDPFVATVQPHKCAQTSLFCRTCKSYSILSVVWCPDSQRIASGCSDATIRIWDANTGKQFGDILFGHRQLVESVAWSPDGQKIVSGSRDQTVRIWDANTGKQIGKPLNGHTNSVYSVAWSPDGQKIVSGSRDQTVRIWDAKTRQQIGKCFKGHIHWVVRVMWSPNSQRIISGDNDNTVIIWDANTRMKILKSKNGYIFNSVWCMAWSPDSQRIVYVNRDRILRIWDVHSAKIRDSLRGHIDLVLCVACPDGQRIVSGDIDGIPSKLFDSFSAVTGPIGTIWMIYVSWKIFRYFTTEKPNVSLDKHRNRKNTIVIGHLTGSQSLLKTVVNDKDDSISINTFEEVSSQLKEIKQLSGDTTEIEIVLHTPGGSLFYSQLIANMIRHWKGKTIARIVGYSASGGTLIALACDQIIMGEDSALGPIDPQLSGYDVMSGKLTMAFSFQEGYEMFSDQSVTINEKNLFVEVLKRHTMKLIPPYMKFLEKLLSKNYPDEQRRNKIIKYFMANQAHSLPIFYDDCVNIGVNVILESTFDTDSSESKGVVKSDDSNESDESGTKSDEKNESNKSDLSSVLEADSEELDRSEPSLESYQIRLKELEMAIVDAKANSPKWPKEKSPSVDEAVTTLWTFMNNNGKYVNKALY